MSDERKGLPSASGYARLAACPGSWLAERDLPSPDTEDSIRGTRIHAALAGIPVPYPPLDADEQETRRLCFELEVRCLDQWFAEIGGRDEWVEKFYERRLWLCDEQGKAIFSGQPDVIVIHGDHAAVFDYKTGWGDVDDAADNLQLRALAVLVRYEWPHLESVTVAVIKPSEGMTPNLVRYESADLDYAESDLRAHLAFAGQPGRPLQPGPHCKYCRAKVGCPALQAEVQTLAKMTLGSGEQRRELISNDTLVALLDRCGPAEAMIGTIKAEARRRLESGEKLEHDGSGYVLAEGASRRTVTDVCKAFGALADAHEVTDLEFLACCKVTIGELEDMLRAKLKSTVKATKEKLDVILGAAGCLERKAAQSTLKRVSLLNGDPTPQTA